MSRYILDTNIFNRIIDGEADRDLFQGLALIGAYVQRLEIEGCPQESRKNELLTIFAEVTSAIELPFTTHWGDPWGGRWSDTDGLHEQIHAAVRKLDKKKRCPNQERDAQIAETAIKGDFTLISEDKNLRDVVQSFGGKAIGLAEMRLLRETLSL
jgi:predicted nucleic acid-binding protein